MPTASTNKLGNMVLMPVSSFNTSMGVVDLAFSANDLQLMNRSFFSDGIVAAYPGPTDGDNSLKVSPLNGFNIQLAPGRVIIDGQVAFIEDVGLTTVSPPGQLSRYDSVIIRRDFIARNAQFGVIMGEQSTTPVPPTLTYNLSGIAEFRLADIWVQAGASQLTQSDIIDQRVFSSLRVNHPHKHDIGMIQQMPFRTAEMPFGWYVCDGRYFANTTKQAIVLNSLPAGFKADWGVVNNGAATCVPDWAYNDGAGIRYPFMRPFSGGSRYPGSLEGDAIRNISGAIYGDFRTYAQPSRSGAMDVAGEANNSVGQAPDAGYRITAFGVDASHQVPVANENRPLNRGMVVAIYLGV